MRSSEELGAGASPSRQGGGETNKPAPWHLKKRRNINADGLVQTRLRNFMFQFPDLEIVGGGGQN